MCKYVDHLAYFDFGVHKYVYFIVTMQNRLSHLSLFSGD
jgi:hypothetical protein